jgi:anti-anti-sigma regulatory factor
MAAATTNMVALPAIIDLDALDPIRDRLIDAIEQGPVTVVAGGVERVSTNALLMLLSAAETARRNNFSFEIAGTPAPMAAAIERLGLAEYFSPITKG